MAAITAAMFILPQIPSASEVIFKGMAGADFEKKAKLEDDPKAVRTLIWWYCLIDLVFLTYLVHVTGGITGSMFAGLYLLIPSLALLLVLGSADLQRAMWLILLTVGGLVGSFLMSHFNEVEYDASFYKHAFDIALLLVTIEGVALLIVQLIILKYQFEKTETESVNPSTT
jgi:hypothetical protein